VAGAPQKDLGGVRTEILLAGGGVWLAISRLQFSTQSTQGLMKEFSHCPHSLFWDPVTPPLVGGQEGLCTQGVLTHMDAAFCDVDTLICDTKLFEGWLRAGPHTAQ
jgi:hypothetical protein